MSGNMYIQKLKEAYDATKKNRADLLMFLSNAHQKISELSKETVEKIAETYKQNAQNERLKPLTKFLEMIVSFNEGNDSDDAFLERFSHIYDNLELWYSQAYTADGEKVLNPDGSEVIRTYGLYPTLWAAFGEEGDPNQVYTFNVDPISEEDTPETQEYKKQLLEYNDQIKKYSQFVTAIKQLGRLVDFYEKQGYINSELKQTLYHLTDQLSKNRTKIELLSNRYSDILKRVSKQHYNDLNFESDWWSGNNTV